MGFQVSSRTSRGRCFLPAPPILALLLLTPAAAQERYTSEDYRSVGRALVCQCGGCNALVHECAMDRCPSSNPIREEIAERLQAGDRPEEVIGMFRDRYGLAILAAPPTSGFHLSAWLLPGVFLLGGAVLAVTLIRRWQREPEAPSADELPPEVVARIEREVDGIR